MFVDECTIEVAAGSGGDGSVSFRREKYVPRGGPDGGDGGKGGDVVLRVNRHLRTLYHLRHIPLLQAADGRPGKGKQMFGAAGEDRIVQVPVGTTLAEIESGRVVAEALVDGDLIVLARGGKGGKGNVHFKSSTRRAPRIAEEGKEGERMRLRLTLRLLADVGLVGMPNAGKSTLLSRVSNARPRIADYPFTTLVPALGIAAVDEEKTFVLADLPGLIRGAHSGKGLGQRFLRHIERTRLLLVLIEITDPRPAETLAILRDELSLWSSELGSRESVVCYSKGDLRTGDRIELPLLEGRAPHVLSAHTGEGVTGLLRELVQRLDAADARRGPHGAGRSLSDGGEDPLDEQGQAVQFDEFPWPTRWVFPDHPGVCISNEERRDRD
ncbi:MAG: GTPase ObgE [Candidatus Eisenbacteria bacterium]